MCCKGLMLPARQMSVGCGKQRVSGVVTEMDNTLKIYGAPCLSDRHLHSVRMLPLASAHRKVVTVTFAGPKSHKIAGTDDQRSRVKHSRSTESSRLLVSKKPRGEAER